MSLFAVGGAPVMTQHSHLETYSSTFEIRGVLNQAGNYVLGPLLITLYDKSLLIDYTAEINSFTECFTTD